MQARSRVLAHHPALLEVDQSIVPGPGLLEMIARCQCLVESNAEVTVVEIAFLLHLLVVPPRAPLGVLLKAASSSGKNPTGRTPWTVSVVLLMAGVCSV